MAFKGAHLGDVGHLGGVLRHGDGRAHAYVQVPEFHGRFPAGTCGAVELLGPRAFQNPLQTSAR
uniref:Uncharacterized protein n=1 Tax=Anguilla anguilla TaxID=7936 RepID=A0A0E9R8A9_ANGAN